MHACVCIYACMYMNIHITDILMHVCIMHAYMHGNIYTYMHVYIYIINNAGLFRQHSNLTVNKVCRLIITS